MLNEVDLFTKRDKVETAIARIKEYCTGKKVLCAFSGGKDSQCCYHLLKEAGVPFTAQYSITRFEPPELIPFIRENYPDVTFRRAYKMSLIDEIAYRGLPNRWFRWCCDAKHKKTEGFDIAVIGVRSEESSRRRDSWRIFGYKQDRTAYLCPIFDWTSLDVWKYLNERNIPHCCLYDQGNTRIGCVCCPLSPRTMRSEADRWPKTANMLYIGLCKHFEYCKAMGGVTKRGKPFKILRHKTPRDAFEFWLDTGNMLLPEHGRGEENDEPCLFSGTGFSEGDGIDNQQGEDNE